MSDASEHFLPRAQNGGAQATNTTKRRARTPRGANTRQLAVLPSMIQFAPAAYSRYDRESIVQRHIRDAIVGWSA